MTTGTAQFLLTSAALEQVRRKLSRPGQTGRVLALRVVRSGCNGYGYDMNLVPSANPEDLSWEQDGITLATDPESAKLLTGTELDYAKSELGGSFTFRNPNAKSACGCGTSFSA